MLVYILFYLILGLIIGSFISMLTHRLIEHLDSDTPELFKALVMDRSRCTHCNTPIKASSLIPVFSWIRQKGKTACCGLKIGYRYLIIEIVTALVTLLVFLVFHSNSNSFNGLGNQGIAFMLFAWALIAITVTDFEYQLIPDRLSLPLMWLGLLVASLDYGLIDLKTSAYGAMAGYVSLWLLFQIHRAFTGKEGMGYGDFKLAAAIGAWLGYVSLTHVFIVAGVLSVLFALAILSYQKWKRFEDAGVGAFAFGPFLAVGALGVGLVQAF